MVSYAMQVYNLTRKLGKVVALDSSSLGSELHCSVDEHAALAYPMTLVNVSVSLTPEEIRYWLLNRLAVRREPGKADNLSCREQAFSTYQHQRPVRGALCGKRRLHTADVKHHPSHLEMPSRKSEGFSRS